MRKLIQTCLSVFLTLHLVLLLPLQAQADVFEDILNQAVEMGGWPSEVPKPLALMELIKIAQGCADTGQSGLVDCVNKAIENPDVANLLGEAVDKIDMGVQVYVDIQSGDYLHLLSILGKTIGCMAAQVITGVPVCGLAEFVADIGGAIVDVAAEIYEFLQDLGAHAKWTGEDFYTFRWYPQVQLGVQINLFTDQSLLPQTFSALTEPIFDSCYTYFRDVDDMSKSNAMDTCNGLRAQFVNEVNSEIEKLVTTAKGLVAKEYDAQTPKQLKIWEPKCDLPSTSVNDIDYLIDTCKQKVKAAIELGKSIAIAKVHNYAEAVGGAVVFNVKSCAKFAHGNDAVINALQEAVKGNLKIANDFEKNPNSAKNALATLKNIFDAYKKDAGPWMESCKTYGDYQAPCLDTLKAAWDYCQQEMQKVPLMPGDLGVKDAAAESVANGKCIARYNGVTYAFKAYLDNHKLTAELPALCPKEGENLLAAQEKCKMHIDIATGKCSGGQPKLLNGKIVQNPVPMSNCTSELNAFKTRWGVDEPLLKQLADAQSIAKGFCEKIGMSGCNPAVQAKVLDCKALIGKAANEIGLVPPTYYNQMNQDIKNLNKAAEACSGSVAVLPGKFINENKAEFIVTKEYASNCPGGDEACKQELLKTLNNCISATPKSGGKKIGGGKFSIADLSAMMTPESQVEKCKPQLQAVLKKYQDKGSGKIVAVDKVREFSPKANLKIRSSGLMAAPPAPSGGPASKEKSAETAATSTEPAVSAGLIKPNIRVKPQIAKEVSPQVRISNIGVTPPLQLKAKGCELPANSRSGAAYECKTDEGMKLCETFLKDHKVPGCKKVSF